jgi:hypothetical protein
MGTRTAEDAPRAALEPDEHGGPGRARAGVPALFRPRRFVGVARHGIRPSGREVLQRLLSGWSVPGSS